MREMGTAQKPTRRYAAFLRGVMPTNAKMPDLKRSFELAGFTDVKTVLSSGNVVFEGPAVPVSELQHRAEEAMRRHLGQPFLTIVRPLDALRRVLRSDPYASFRLAPGSKKIVTFLRGKPKAELSLPVELHGARILCRIGSEVFSAYVRTPRGPVFMTLIERSFGKEQTTRTWETVMKIAR